MPESDWRQLLSTQVDKKWVRFSWVSLRALLSSANDLIGKGTPRIVNDIRRSWMEGVDSSLVLSLPNADSFLVLGDPGEQDASQYAVVPQLLHHQQVAFMVIMSDVIYPSGAINDYVDGFYHPYEAFKPPILALPGNHDWYDGLRGFMWHFCERGALPASAFHAKGYSIRERWYRRLWQQGGDPRADMPPGAMRPRADTSPGRTTRLIRESCSSRASTPASRERSTRDRLSG
jgi:hypothetical protein